MLRGRGVDDPGKVKIEFSVVPDRGECQVSATRCFLPDQKILFLAEVIRFLNLEIWVITVCARTLNALYRKWAFLEFKNISSPTNFEIDP